MGWERAEGERSEEGRKQFRIVLNAQFVPKVRAFMKFQTLAWIMPPGSLPWEAPSALTTRPCYIRREVLTISRLGKGQRGERERAQSTVRGRESAPASKCERGPAPGTSDRLPGRPSAIQSRRPPARPPSGEQQGGKGRSGSQPATSGIP